MAQSSNMANSNTQNLFENFIPFDVQYAGIIPEIPADMDPTGRTDILRVIDEAKKEKRIPHETTSENDSTLVLNAYSLRILSKTNQETLLCVPVHMLAAIGFVKDDGLNILAIKIGEVGGNKEIYDLAVVYCKSPKQAEEVCDMMSHCFQAVFTEATSQYFDKRIVEGSLRDPNLELLNLNAGSGESVPDNDMVPFGSRDSPSDLHSRNRGAHMLIHRSSMATTTQSESDQFSAYAAEQIQNYMHMLHMTLSAEELKQFAVLLKRWRSENLPFPEFCQKVLELYGSERRNLLAGMKPFIPEKDLAYFDSFLDQSHGMVGEGASAGTSGYGTVTIETTTAEVHNSGETRKKSGLGKSGEVGQDVKL